MRALRHLIRFCCALAVLCSVAVPASDARPRQAAQEDDAVRLLRIAIDRYIELHEQLDPVAPPLHKSIPASQISAHRQELSKLIAAARANARRGHVLSAKVESYLRSAIKSEYPGAEIEQLRSIIANDDDDDAAKPVFRLRINAPIPNLEGAPIMPPRLLAKLPALPEELEYRFVGRHFVLRDTETELVVDYIYNVVP